MTVDFKAKVDFDVYMTHPTMWINWERNTLTASPLWRRSLNFKEMKI